MGSGKFIRGDVMGVFSVIMGMLKVEKWLGGIYGRGK